MGADAHAASGRLELLERWSKGLQVLHVAHNIASERFSRWSRITGLATAMLSTVVGTAIFASLSSSDSPTVRVAAGAFSLVAAALGAGQLVWNYPELASRHRDAAVQYASLRRRVDLAKVNDERLRDSDIDTMSSEWQEIEQSAPTLPAIPRRLARRAITAYESRANALPGSSHE
ncbi:SLATT domain-containing protein [Streptomyces sp. NPDC020742]|uniref:SLATT domain-containing protein n=1 Tax=unclassified Streptomyces TaxID=2593676 RepID=UPI0033C6D303